ncbi:MAG: hypothetical protein KDB94_09200 [Acidobacteria bacterium]|nr:hypothetical protein [Acidobacteriota bacterium]MCB9378983.1 hypothetical protein [Holophagales bacterium]
MPFEPNVVRLWRSLSRDARTEAARSFWERPTEEAAVAAAQEIVKILRVRPQAFHKIPLEQRVRAVAGLAAPPDSLAEALLISLHVDSRRALLIAFLDALAIPHEEGMIDDESDDFDPPTADAVRAALPALLERFPADEIRTYWNALWLQDGERWTALVDVVDELPAPSA